MLIKSNIDETRFLIVDVGGQRNERRKWINSFNNVKCVMFVASLIGYCQTLFEDEKTNRMDEAVELFGEVMNYEWIGKTSVVLLLNKSDVIESTLQKVMRALTPILTIQKPFKDHFGDFEGENHPDDVLKYIKKLFKSKTGSKKVGDNFRHFLT